MKLLSLRTLIIAVGVLATMAGLSALKRTDTKADQ